MGVKAVSLPDDLIKELEEAARDGNRGFSAEVRMRIENEKRLRAGWGGELSVGGPVTDAMRNSIAGDVILLGGASVETRAKDGVVATKEISGYDLGSGLVKGPADPKFDPLVEEDRVLEFGPELPKKAIVVNLGPVGEGSVRPLTKEEIRAKSEKIASGIPGVVKAVDLGKVEVPGFGVVDAKYVIPDRKLEVTDEKEVDFMKNTISNEKSPKKRAKGSMAVVMTKGFYREEFGTAEEAEKEAVKLGWTKGEYRIEDIV